MMTKPTSMKLLSDLVGRLRANGVKLDLIDCKVRLTGKLSTLPAELRELVAEHGKSLAAVLIRERHYSGLMQILRVECLRVGVDPAVVDHLPVEELDALNDQLGLGGWKPDGNGEPLLHSLSEFYFKEVTSENDCPRNAASAADRGGHQA
jgi:hypothetical protein